MHRERPQRTKTNCVSNEGSAYLTSVQSYIDFIKGLKSDPSKIFVGTIIGNPSPVEIGQFTTGEIAGEPKLEKSCSDRDLGEGNPGIRLNQFTAGFIHHATRSVCNTGGLQFLAEKLKGM